MAYMADFQRTLSTSLSVGSWVAATTRPRRLEFYDFVFGSEATPADAAVLWTVQRCTAAGTSTAVTPQPQDVADFATESAAGENHSVDPTYTANVILLNTALNQRATFRWVATPGGEMRVPATAASGIGIRTTVISTGTPVGTATVHAREL